MAEGILSGKIIMLEPRRLAARAVAERIAANLGEEPGRTVGYRMRFESRVSAATRIEVVTERLLTRMLTEDPTLDGVGCVIFDEFHERSIDSDLALAMTLECQRSVREDLRIVVMSATLDAEGLCARLGAPLLEFGRSPFPVRTDYLAVTPEPGEICGVVVRKVVETLAGEKGDVLVFLPGEGEIHRCREALEGVLGDGRVRVLPLYGTMDIAAQREAVAPCRDGERKVVLATPVAETSLTIEGVTAVIDSGLCRRPVFDAQTTLSRLELQRISIDMADQRAGRAGRTGPGVCHRLWSLGTHSTMAAGRTEEVLTADLAGAVLDIAVWGCGRPEDLPWVTPPPASHLRCARELLMTLGAIEGDGARGAAGAGAEAGGSGSGAGCAATSGAGAEVGGSGSGAGCAATSGGALRVTAAGRRMAALPCHPRLAKMLSEAAGPEEKRLAAEIAAALEQRGGGAGGLAAEAGGCADLCGRIAELRRARKPSFTKAVAQYAALTAPAGRAAAASSGPAPASGLHPDGQSPASGVQPDRQSPASGLQPHGQSPARRDLGTYAGDSRKCQPDEPFTAGKLLARAFPERIARNQGNGRFLLAGGAFAAMSAADPVAACEWIVVASMGISEGREGRIFLAAPVAPEDLRELAVSRKRVGWNSRAGRVVAENELRLGRLTLESRPCGDVTPEEVLCAVSQAAAKEGLSMFNFTNESANLQRRIAALASWHPELALPDVTTPSLLSDCSAWLPTFIPSSTGPGCAVTGRDLISPDVASGNPAPHGAASGGARLISIADLRRIDMCEVVWSRLDYAQRHSVETLAPSHITVPTGSRIRVEYRQGADLPVVRVRLQECFGLLDTPTVDGGRRKVLMELLSPGFKPVQLTSDLRSFWDGTYFEVRKELRLRYPKHSWPEDPLSAPAVRGVRKKQG